MCEERFLQPVFPSRQINGAYLDLGWHFLCPEAKNRGSSTCVWEAEKTKVRLGFSTNYPGAGSHGCHHLSFDFVLRRPLPVYDTGIIFLCCKSPHITRSRSDIVKKPL